jgi:hypothetical protein
MSGGMESFPLPGMGVPVVAVRAPGSGVGWWAGASSAPSMVMAPS